MMGIRKPKEGDLVKQCLQWLKLRYSRGVFFRVNCGATKIGDRFIKFGSLAGVSDIIGVLPIRTSKLWQEHGWEMRDLPSSFIAVEVKMPRGRLQPSQEAFLEAVKGAGGIAGVVRSLNDLEQLVEEK